MPRKRKQLRYIGVVLREYRNKVGLTQKELAASLGVSINYISLIEIGKEYPSIDTLIRFAEGLNIEAGDILNTIVEREKAIGKKFLCLDNGE